MLLAPLLAGPAGTAAFFAVRSGDPTVPGVLWVLAWMSAPFLILAACFRWSGLLRHRRFAAWTIAACTVTLAAPTVRVYGELATEPVGGTMPGLGLAVTPVVMGTILSAGGGWGLGIAAVAALALLGRGRSWEPSR